MVGSTSNEYKSRGDIMLQVGTKYSVTARYRHHQRIGRQTEYGGAG